MLWTHPSHPGRRVRLGYCMNLHAADDVAGVRDGIERIAAPLARRLGGGDAFGVGAYLPDPVARAWDAADFHAFVADRGLDPYTYNAFPFGGFHAEGLKAEVFRPTWLESARERFTAAVARTAARRATPAPEHVSISTHTGAFAAWLRGDDDREAIARAFARAAGELARVEEETGTRVVLSLEPEPRSLANDTAELARFYELAREPACDELAGRVGAARAEELWRRHVGTCLDACHAAVEFEDPAEAVANATACGHPLGKVQYSSALRLPNPAGDARGRERLFELAEPTFLHQTTGRSPAGLVRALDLPELAERWRAGDAELAACDEWRCHFHVPIDRGGALAPDEAGGLATTREHSDRLVDHVLAHPEAWGVAELHLEIETYTWSVLPGLARGDGDLVDGLAREYAHAGTRLEAAGWSRSAKSEPPA